MSKYNKKNHRSDCNDYNNNDDCDKRIIKYRELDCISRNGECKRTYDNRISLSRSQLDLDYNCKNYTKNYYENEAKYKCECRSCHKKIRKTNDKYNCSCFNLRRISGYTNCFFHDIYGHLPDCVIEEYKKQVKFIVKGNIYGFEEKVKRYICESCYDNPFGGFDTTLFGPSNCSIFVPKPCKIFSDCQASSMVELYTMAYSINLPFIYFERDSETNMDVNNLLEILNLNDVKSNLPYPPSGLSQITKDTIYRLKYYNNNNGPYLSQFFFWFVKDCGESSTLIKLLPSSRSSEKTTYRWGITKGQSAALLNCLTKENITKESADTLTENAPASIYINSGHYLGQLTNVCSCGNLSYSLPLIFENFLKIPYNPTLPTYRNIKYINVGKIQNIASCICNIAKTISYYWKWNVYRYMRPIAAGLYTHNSLNEGIKYCWPEWYINLTDELEEFWKNVKNNNKDLWEGYNSSQKDHTVPRLSDKNSYTLNIGLRDGGPNSPSYPSSIICCIAAVITVIKFFYSTNTSLNNIEIIQSSQQGIANLFRPNADGSNFNILPNTYSNLTVEDELNKLLSNYAIGRMFLGINTRQDISAGAYLGEKIAIRCLGDILSSWYEDEIKYYKSKCYIKPPKVKIRNLKGDIISIHPTSCC